MVKYHINKQGVPAICRAKSQPCPLGEHFDTESGANEYIQNKMEKEFGIISTGGNIKLDKRQVKEEYEAQLEIVKRGDFKSRNEEEAMRTKLARLSKRNKGSTTRETSFQELLQDMGQPDSGGTVNITGNKVTMPTVGFCASPYPEYSKVYEDHTKLTDESIMEYIENLRNNSEVFDGDKQPHIGFWNDPEDGKVYLDVSEVYQDATSARKACEENDQIAYFDLQTFESVDVDRSAKSGQL